MSSPRKLTSSRQHEGERNVILLVSVLWDFSWKQPQRSAKEFFIRPAFPIRDMYMTRLLVNLLWFSRNYYNLAAVLSLILIYFTPQYALIAAMSGVMHFIKWRSVQNLEIHDTASNNNNNNNNNNTKKEDNKSLLIYLLILLQLFCCTFVWYLCGLISVIKCIIIVSTPIIAHAFFTPYTDEAFALYCDVLRKKDLPVPMPRSPTRIFSTVSPKFEVLGKRDFVSSLSSSSSSPKNRSHHQSNSLNNIRTVLSHSFTSLGLPRKGGGLNGFRRTNNNNNSGLENTRRATITIVKKHKDKIFSPSINIQHLEKKLECPKVVSPKLVSTESKEIYLGDKHNHLNLQFNEEDVALMPASPIVQEFPLFCAPIKSTTSRDQRKDDDDDDDDEEETTIKTNSDYNCSGSVNGSVISFLNLMQNPDSIETPKGTTFTSNNNNSNNNKTASASNASLSKSCNVNISPKCEEGLSEAPESEYIIKKPPSHINLENTSAIE